MPRIFRGNEMIVGKLTDRMTKTIVQCPGSFATVYVGDGHSKVKGNDRRGKHFPSVPQQEDQIG
ncbi:MAG: hypothetical protein BGO08_09550 [Altererythrobacter sp. 66-12]|nr:MAG: hypothetical protein BGO08_09550 [Altererythrobacter sp. 66-12]